MTQTTEALVPVSDTATELIAGRRTRAGRNVRITAGLLDVAAMASPALPLSIVAATLRAAEVLYIVMPIAFLSVWLWMQIWQGLTGSSFGKSMLGLRLVRVTDNRPGGSARVFLRSGFFVGTFGFAAAPVLRSAEPRWGLHDRISGLQVIDGSARLGVAPPGKGLACLPIPVAGRR